MKQRLDWLISQMKIIGGAEVFTRVVVPLLQNENFHLRVIVLAEGGKYLEELAHEGIETIELGLKKGDFFRGMVTLSRIWSNKPPDIIHTHLYHAGILGRISASISGIRRIIVHQHGLELNRKKWRSLLDRHTQRLVHQYAVTCQAIGKQLSQREKVPPSKINVIYNGVDLNAILDRFHQPAGETLISPKDNFPIIGSIGRLSYEKGFDIILQALSFLQQVNLFPTVFFIGTGPDEQKLRQTAIQLNVEKQVHFSGFQRDKISWLRQMDVYLQASRWEGISLSLLEAMGAGLPVIATDVGGTSEVIQPMLSGILIPPEDPHEMAQKIFDLIHNPSLRRALGSQAQEHIKNHFTIQHTLEQLLSLYETVTRV
jgi:glycosyltransferase involved in cell wall biosynthesis